jgi:protein ImuB
MLLEARLARVSLKEPVRYLGLRATDILPLAPDNGDLYAPVTGTGRDWKTLLAQLEARLSVENVHALGVRADYRPERAWRMTRGTDPFSSAPAGNPGKQRADEGAGPFSRSLPLWLLPRPQPLETAAGAPCRRGRLTLQKGPQRIESGWWDAAPVARDYYVATDSAGARLWIFRDLGAPQRWYLHGVFG